MKLTHFILELGDGWAPTILETEEEFNFLKGAMGLFVSTYDHCAYIGGSTCIPSSDEPIAFSDYESDTSFGKIILICILK